MRFSPCDRLLAMTGLFVILSFFPFGAGAANETPRLLPDKTLTPGVVRSTDVAEICTPGYSKSVRATTREMKDSVYQSYDVKKDRKKYKIDHLIPLGIGGADEVSNLWPSPLFPRDFNGRDKDRLEFRLYRMVCHEGYDVRKAQEEIRTDWIAAFHKHCALPGSCPSFVDYMESKGTPVGRKKTQPSPGSSVK